MGLNIFKNKKENQRFSCFPKPLRFCKKGLFFTILAIYLLSLFLLAYTSMSLVRNRGPINRRIETLNDFIFSLEEDFSRELYVAGFRSIFLLEKYIVEEGEYIIDVGEYTGGIQGRINELFTQGTLYGVEQGLMEGATFQEILEDINEDANKINAQVSYTGTPTIVFRHDDPWNVTVVLSVNLVIEDKADLVSWERGAVFTAKVPINLFDDPLYVRNTGGLVVNKFTKTIYTDFVDEEGVATNLVDHVANSYYKESETAPSFLQRLEGGVSVSEQGIESFVYLPDLSFQGITAKTKSCIDYIYFDPANNPEKHQVEGMSDWFWIDDAHDESYGIIEP